MLTGGVGRLRGVKPCPLKRRVGSYQPRTQPENADRKSDAGHVQEYSGCAGSAGGRHYLIIARSEDATGPWGTEWAGLSVPAQDVLRKVVQCLAKRRTLECDKLGPGALGVRSREPPCFINRARVPSEPEQILA